MPTVDTRAGAVAYSETGEGPALLLLHATLHNRHDYDAVAPASPHPAGGPWFADVLEDVVDGLGLTDVALVGNSVGGFAVSRFAIRRPEATRAVVLVNASGFTPLNAGTRAFCRLMGRPAVNARAVPHLVPWYMKASNDFDRGITERTVARGRTPDGIAVSAALWHSFSDPAYDLRAQAAAHRAPTLMVWGMRDPVLGPRAGKAARRLLPHAEFVGLDTGHVPFASDPAGFLDAVGPFLARHREPVGGSGERHA